VSTSPLRGADVLALYDEALPQVFGYLLRRCDDRTVAEDLTSETFLAAVASPPDQAASVAWLIGVARHKLADHWRWTARQSRLRDAVGDPEAESDDPWDVELDVLVAHQVLNRLAPHHRAALTLRYLDGLSVPETAVLLERSVHATEALLTRARRAFRQAYDDPSRPECRDDLPRDSTGGAR
jgi:RNA polymerase sigma-70 factor, ECF subfamily